MTNIQVVADKISNNLQSGINSHITTEYGVGQVAAVTVAVQNLGLTLAHVCISVYLDILAGFAEVLNSDVILFDDIDDEKAIKSIMELPQFADSVFILRRKENLPGFEHIDV